jgi:WD40 repeat protein
MIRAKQIQAGQQAKADANESGKEYSALALGIAAVGLSNPAEAPPEAVDGLRAALRQIDNKVLWRENATVPSPSRVEISRDGKLVLTVNPTEVCVWDAVTGENLTRYSKPENGELSQVDFFPDSKFLFIVISPVDLKYGESQSKVNQGEGRSRVALEGERKVLILEARSGEEVNDLKEELKGAWGVEVSDDGKHILADFRDNIKIIDVASKKMVSAPAFQPNLLQIALSTDGTRLVAVYGGSKVELLATESGKVINSFNVGIQRTGDLWDSIAFSPDGKRGALVRSSSSSGETAGIVWNNAKGEILSSLKSTIKRVDDASFSLDNNSVTIFGDGKAETYDVATGSRIQTSSLPQGEITQHSGTNFLAVRNENGKSRTIIWDGLVGKLKAQMELNRSQIVRAAMTPDALQCVVVSEDNLFVVWAVGEPLAVDTLPVEQLVTVACEKLQHQKEYIPVSGFCKEHSAGP